MIFDRTTRAYRGRLPVTNLDGTPYLFWGSFTIRKTNLNQLLIVANQAHTTDLIFTDFSGQILRKKELKYEWQGEISPDGTTACVTGDTLNKEIISLTTGKRIASIAVKDTLACVISEAGYVYVLEYGYGMNGIFGGKVNPFIKRTRISVFDMKGVKIRDIGLYGSPNHEISPWGGDRNFACKLKFGPTGLLAYEELRFDWGWYSPGGACGGEGITRVGGFPAFAHTYVASTSYFHYTPE